MQAMTKCVMAHRSARGLEHQVHQSSFATFLIVLDHYCGCSVDGRLQFLQQLQQLYLVWFAVSACSYQQLQFCHKHIKTQALLLIVIQVALHVAGALLCHSQIHKEQGIAL